MLRNRWSKILGGLLVFLLVAAAATIFSFGVTIPEALTMIGLLKKTVISQDPGYFEVQENVSLLPLGEATEWDAGLVLVSDIVYHNGTYYLFYTGQSVSQPRAIGLATSQDGLVWEKSPNNPIIAGDGSGFDAYSAFNAVVLFDDGEWVLYYGAHESQPSLPPGRAIGRAAALAPEGPWVRSDLPVVTPGSGVAWDSSGINPSSIVKIDSEYRLYYSGTLHGFWGRIGMATSPDGINWRKYDDPQTGGRRYGESDPIMQPLSPESWDSGSQWDSYVFARDAGWGMVYHGVTPGRPAHESQLGLGYATSLDGIHWDPVSDSPIMVLPDRFAQTPVLLPRDDQEWLFYTSFSWRGTAPQMELAIGKLPKL